MILLYKCLVLVALISSVYNAPRSRSKSKIQLESKYDQKQTGDYNIQLHLKDFQLLALLGGSSDVGDYEYVNYDYADLTVKPPVQLSSTEGSASNATQKPNEITSGSNLVYFTYGNASSVTIEQKPQTTAPSVEEVVTEKEKPAPLEVVITTQKVVVTTEKEIATTLKPKLSTEPPTVQPSSVKPPLVASRINNKVGKVGKTNDEDELETSAPEEHVKEELEVAVPLTNIAILPLQSKALNRRVHHIHSRNGHGGRVKKCGYGYARDKRGRCRKLKRYPQVLKINRNSSPPPPVKTNRISSQLHSRYRSPIPPN